MNLELSDEETAALIQELHDIVENDRYPFSPRRRSPIEARAKLYPTLRGILAELRPEPVRGVELRSRLDHPAVAAAEGVCATASCRSQKGPARLSTV